MDLTFRSIDPSRHRARYYRVSVERDLFGAPYMRAVLGHIGHKMRVREERFVDGVALERRCHELLKRRRRNSYALSSSPSTTTEIRP